VPRRAGRPPLDPNDRSTPVHVQLPSKQYDTLYALAQRHRCTVPEVIRRVLRGRVPRDDQDDVDDEE
jgi:hypothetical protein